MRPQSEARSEYLGGDMTYIAYSQTGTRRLLEVPPVADRELEIQAAISAAQALFHDYLATVWAYDRLTSKSIKILDRGSWKIGKDPTQ